MKHSKSKVLKTIALVLLIGVCIVTHIPFFTMALLIFVGHFVLNVCDYIEETRKEMNLEIEEESVEEKLYKPNPHEFDWENVDYETHNNLKDEEVNKSLSEESAFAERMKSTLSIK